MSIKHSCTVSIIMPVYNGEQFISEAINSVRQQTYTDWELIIVDDGSTDMSCNIIMEFVHSDDRIKLHHNPSPCGMPSVPRNIGIDKAHGRYIAFLDADDMWLNHKLEEQLKLFDNDKTAIVFSFYEKIDVNGYRNNRIVYSPQQITYNKMLHSNYIGNLTGIYDVAKIGKVHFMDIHHEDYVFWMNILKKGYIAKNTLTVTALYREHSKSISSNKIRNIKWQWNILRNIEKIGFLHSAYYLAYYMVKGFMKHSV